MRYKVDIARNHEAPRIRFLCVEDAGYGYLADADWSDLGSYWLVARDRDDEIVGCIQAIHGLPMARLDYLAIDSILEIRERARVAHALIHRSLALMRAGGASVCISGVAQEQLDWLRQVGKRGGTVVCSGHFIAKRLR